MVDYDKDDDDDGNDIFDYDDDNDASDDYDDDNDASDDYDDDNDASDDYDDDEGGGDNGSGTKSNYYADCDKIRMTMIIKMLSDCDGEEDEFDDGDKCDDDEDDGVRIKIMILSKMIILKMVKNVVMSML